MNGQLLRGRIGHWPLVRLKPSAALSCAGPAARSARIPAPAMRSRATAYLTLFCASYATRPDLMRRGRAASGNGDREGRGLQVTWLHERDGSGILVRHFLADDRCQTVRFRH